MNKFFESFNENDVFLLCCLAVAMIVFCIGYGAGVNAEVNQDDYWDIYYQGYDQAAVDYASDPDPLVIAEFKVVSLEVLDANVGNQGEKISNIFKISLQSESNDTDILNVSILRVNNPALDPDLKVGSTMYCINGTEYVTGSDKRIGMYLPESMLEDYNTDNMYDPFEAELQQLQ